jgi:protein involved in polysaccharide export with SLBB domain
VRFCASVMSIFLCGCALMAQQTASPQTADNPAGAASENAAAPAPDFRLSSGDTIEVKFFYTPELDDTVQIRPDGLVSLPLIGQVPVAGRTVSQTVQELQVRYSKVLKSPSISVQVRNFAGHKIYVGGEVARPGTIDLASDISLMDALLESGGPKYTAAKYALLIHKSEDEKPLVRKVSLQRHGTEASEATLVRVEAFDVVMVPESKIAHTDRWIDQHIRQLVPASMGAGFSYLFNGGTIIP